VFSFRLIVLELLTGRAGFSLDFTQLQLMSRVVMEKMRPDVPDFIAPKVRRLIWHCFGYDSAGQPSVVEIVERLAEMDFRTASGENSGKVGGLAKAIED
jgi:hypothetical protein